MLKRAIKYEDFDGNEQTDICYFNISKPEVIELEMQHSEGLGAWIQSVIDAKDNKTLLDLFKKIVLLAYGEKSSDGKHFLKSDEIREKFSQSAAYIAFFTELATNDNAAAEFMLAVMPKDMVEGMQKTMSPAPPIS